jgi:hypothetical protein
LGLGGPVRAASSLGVDLVRVRVRIRIRVRVRVRFRVRVRVRVRVTVTVRVAAPSSLGTDQVSPASALSDRAW